MTKVLVLGAGGLLGSTLCALYPENTLPFTSKECDITDAASVYLTIRNNDPDVVINCAGIVPKAQDDLLTLYKVNSLGPKIIAQVCDVLGKKMIHVSTDCVFSGRAGYYVEDDLPNPDTHYGMSKYLGEVIDFPHLTVRTSFVGLPDPKGHGLLAWFKKQVEAGEKVEGWTNTLWNGLTAVELSHILMEWADDWYHSGLVHLGGDKISKFELLSTVRDVYGWGVEITPVEGPKVNKVLKSDNYELPKIKSFKQMVEEMKEMEDVFTSYHNRVTSGTESGV